jgi:hypothetical protein
LSVYGYPNNFLPPPTADCAPLLFFWAGPANQAMIAKPQKAADGEVKQMEMLVLLLVRIFPYHRYSFMFKWL